MTDPLTPLRLPSVPQSPFASMLDRQSEYLKEQQANAPIPSSAVMFADKMLNKVQVQTRMPDLANSSALVSPIPVADRSRGNILPDKTAPVEAQAAGATKTIGDLLSTTSIPGILYTAAQTFGMLNPTESAKAADERLAKENQQIRDDQQSAALQHRLNSVLDADPTNGAFDYPNEFRPLRGTEKIDNEDGSISTELEMTVTMPDGKVANIPSIWIKNDGSKPGVFSERDAIEKAAQYEHLTGRSFPRFDTTDAAVAAAKKRSAEGGTGSEQKPLAKTEQDIAEISAEDEKKAELAATVARRNIAKAAVETGIGQPTQTWWLNAVDVGVRSGLMTGTDALRSAAGLHELIKASINGTEPQRIEARAILDGIDKQLNVMLPGDKTRSKDFVTELASGTGSMAAFMIGAYVGRAFGVSAGVGSGILGASSQAGSMYEDADDHGATMGQKYLTLLVGAGLGATEAIPIDRFFMRAEKLSGGRVTELLKTTAAGSLQEFMQETLQNLGEDIGAKALYDPERQIDLAAALRAGGVGAIIGGATSGIVDVVEKVGGTGGPAGEDVQLSVDAAQRLGQQVFDAAQQQFDSAVPTEEEVTTNEAPGAPLPGEAETTTEQTVETPPQTNTAEPVDAAAAFEEETTAAAEEAAVEAATPELEIDPVQAAKAGAVLESLGIDPAAIQAAADTLVTLNDQEAVSALEQKEKAKPAAIEKAPDTYKGGTVPALREDGKVELTHWSNEALTTLDPVVADTRTKQSTPELRRAGGPDWVPRVYYGVDAHYKRPAGHRKAQDAANKTGEPGAQAGLGYVNEGLSGPVRHTVAIDPDRLYNYIEDPLKLRDKVTATTPGEIATQMEKAIRDAGFDGAWFERSPVGASATLFTPQAVESVHQDHLNQWIKAPPTGTPLPKNMEKGAKRPAGWFPSPKELAARVQSVQLTDEDLARLPELNASSTGPIPSVVQAARAYAQDNNIPFRRQGEYVKADPDRGRRIAREYENMEHNPNDPQVRAAFEAMIEETLAQYQYVKASGLKVEFIEPGQPDPYPQGPKQVLEDLQAGHLWTFPTDQGFGSLTEAEATNPLLRATNEKIGERTLLANDVFRIVHDFFGHGMEGSNFGARGEENAWQSHMRLFTEKALPAVTSETRGQNSWVNFGPYGEQNRANQKETVYADQKTGLMPSWTWREGVDYDTVVEAFEREQADDPAGSIEQALVDAPDAPAELKQEAEEAISAMTANNRAPYVGEQLRPQRGISEGQTTAPTPEPDQNLNTIGQNLIKLLGTTVRTGRLMKKKGIQGQYNFRSGVLRMKTRDDLSTLAHEAGHAMHDNRSPIIEQFIDNNEAAVIGLGASIYPADLSNATVEVQRKEGFAEFFRIFTLNRNYARKRFPTLTNGFEAMLRREDGAFLSGLDAIGTQFHTWVNMPSTQMVKSYIASSAVPSTSEEVYATLKEEGISELMNRWAKTLLRGGINKYQPVDEIVTALLDVSAKNGHLVDLKKAYDPRALARLASNSSSRAMMQVRDGVFGYRSNDPATAGLQQAIMISQGLDANSSAAQFNQDRLDDFDAYLVAKRAMVEYDNMYAGELERAPVGFSRGDAQRAIIEFEKKYGQSFKQAAQLVHEYGMALWKKTFDAGLMTAETYQEGLKRQFYVPLMRDMTDRGRSDLGPSVLTRGERSVVKRFKGSDRNIISPLEALMHKTFALEKTIQENEVKKNLAMLAGKAGTGAGEFAERIPAKQLIGQAFSVEDVARQLTKDPSIGQIEAQDLIDILQATMDQGKMITMFRSDTASTLGENILFYWEAGQLQALQLKDGDTGAAVVNLLHGIGQDNMPMGTELVAATTTAFRSAITSWPDFAIVNYIRDQASAWLLTDVGYIPFVTGAKGIKAEVQQTRLARDYNAAMGTMGGINVATVHDARVNRDLESLRKRGYLASIFAEKGFLGAVKGIAHVTSITETGTRMGIFQAAYNRAIADGLSEYEAGIEASYTATDYINFGQHGSRTMYFRRTIPFLNAAMQGLYKTLRTLGGDEARQRIGLRNVLTAYLKGVNGMTLTRSEQKAISTGRKAWIKMSALAMISAALSLAFRDDEDYQNISEYMRQTNWVFPLGEGRFIAVPKPFDLAIMSNFAERAIEMANGDEKAMRRFLDGAFRTLSPSLSDPLIGTAWQLAFNKNTFTGTEIVPDYMQSLPPEMQYNQYTSTVAKQISKMTGMSAMKVDFLMDSIGASASRDLKTLTNQLNPSSGTMDLTDAPILRRFYKDSTRGNVAAQDFWKQASMTNGTLRQAERGYRHYVDVGNDAAAQNFLVNRPPEEQAYALLMAHQKVDAKRLHPMVRARQISSVISELRREIASDIGPDDTTFTDAGSIRLSPRMKTDADNLLSDITTRETRNTMIAMEQPGWKGKKQSDVTYTLDILRQHSPELADELDRRLTKAGVYNDKLVYDTWPELKARLLADRDFAILTDLSALAKATPR